MRVGVHRRAVGHVGDGDEIGGTLTAEELAHVGAAAQALIAVAALRCPRYAHAIAHLHATDFGANGLDDPDAAVALNNRHVVQSRCGGAGSRRGRRPSGGGIRCRLRRRARLQAENGTDVGVTQVGGFSANEDLTAAYRSQRQLVQRRSTGPGAARNPAAKSARGDDRGRLAAERCRPDGNRTGRCRGRGTRQETSSGKASVVHHDLGSHIVPASRVLCGSGGCCRIGESVSGEQRAGDDV
jgi:hypothetical protein